jgi:mono/diheme cytochrome c family protein
MGHPAGLAVSDPPGLKAPWIGGANPTMTSWSGPWGRSYTSNLTPDAETGIGSWTEQQFIDTIRNGKHLGTGRSLLPPMPWPAFRHLADDDLAAIFTYLRTIPAIRNKVPDPVLPAGPPMPDPPLPAIQTLKVAPNHADPVVRGRYLVTAKGCGDCHTPMRMGANGPEPDTSRLLSGHPAALAVAEAPKLPQPWTWASTATNTAFAGPWGISYAINLTSDEETGIGAWSEQVFVNAMKTGRHMGVGRPILPPMPWSGYSKMTDDDLKAIFAYLKSVPAKSNRAPEAVVAEAPAAPQPPSAPAPPTPRQ